MIKRDANQLVEAALKGQMDAQYELGKAYENGCGIEMDFYKAFKWYQRAAMQGHSGAQFCLG